MYVSKARPSYIANIIPIKYLITVTLFLSGLYHFPTTSLMINLKRSKKINRLLGEPELPSQPSSLALTFLL